MIKITAWLQKYPGWTALAAGAVSATGFAPLDLWPLTVLALAVLIHLVAIVPSAKSAFRTGWLFGLGHFCVGLNWIAGSFRYQDAMPVWLGWVAVFMLSLYLAFYPALAAAAAHWIAGRAVSEKPDRATLSFPLIFGFAGCWIITEWLRSWVFTGFAWNPLGAALLPLQLAGGARYLGTYALGGIMIMLTGLAVAALNQQSRRAAALMIPFFLFTTYHYIPSGPAPTLTTDITIVQPNIGQQDKYQDGYEALNYKKLAQFSRALPDQGPRLLLWPEAAIPDYLEDGYPFRFYQFQPGESAGGARARLTKLMRPNDVLLLGSNRLVIDKDGQLIGARNSMSVMDAGGNFLDHYDKAHLVPYGEYLALRWLLEPLGATRLVPGDVDFWPGPGARTLPIKAFNKSPIKVGIQICYEIIFSGQVVDRNNRPHFIFNPSNDAWFGSWGSPQFLAQARLRAIEEGLPVVRATPTGISALIDADGRIIKSLPIAVAGRIDAQLPMPKPPTIFAQYGNILPLIFAVILLVIALLPVVSRRSSR